MDEIRLLQKEDVEVRVAQTTTTSGGVVKANLLIYKNARVDMKILDELYTPMGWKRTHRLIGDRLYCLVEVWDKEKKEWVGKEDVGTESYTEKEKGQASDSFKRAGFCWGIGRELYTCPFVWINLRQDEWRMSNGRKQPKTRFYVDAIEYQDGKVSYLSIVDDRGVERYKWGKHDDDAVGAACLEAAGAGDLKELEAIYHKYEKQYKSNYCGEHYHCKYIAL